METEQNCNILTPTLMAISDVSFSFSWCPSGGPGAQLSACFLYHILSPTHLISNSIGGPKGPFCRVVAFPTTSLQLVWTPTHWLPVLTELYNSSIAHSISILMASQAGICHFRRLWTGMFDRHQAEITVMQFRGHSLPVHQSMSVPWDFTLSHFVSQAYLRDFLPELPSECVTSFRCITLEWHVGRSKVNIKHLNYDCVRKELCCPSRLSNTFTSVWWVYYEFVFTFSAVSYMSCSSYDVLEMGSRQPYSCCFLGYCFLDFFNIARSTLVQLSYSFFSIR